MNKQQYKSLPEDLKLDAKLAIVLGRAETLSFYKGNLIHFFSVDCVWTPRQDKALLWDLIGDFAIIDKRKNGTVAVCINHTSNWHTAQTSEEALIRAYCADDPQGHLAKWCESEGYQYG